MFEYLVNVTLQILKYEGEKDTLFQIEGLKKKIINWNLFCLWLMHMCIKVRFSNMAFAVIHGS